MSEGLLNTWIQKIFGASWKSTLAGWAVGFLTGYQEFLKFLQGEDFNTQVLIAAIVFVFWGYSQRDNSVNDNEAGTPH